MVPYGLVFPPYFPLGTGVFPPSLSAQTSLTRNPCNAADLQRWLQVGHTQVWQDVLFPLQIERVGKDSLRHEEIFSAPI